MSSFISRRITESLQLESEWQSLPNQENPGQIAREIAQGQLTELKRKNNYQEEPAVPAEVKPASEKESIPVSYDRILSEVIAFGIEFSGDTKEKEACAKMITESLKRLNIPELRDISLIGQGATSYAIKIEYVENGHLFQKVLKVPKTFKNFPDLTQKVVGNPEYEYGKINNALEVKKDEVIPIWESGYFEIKADSIVPEKTGVYAVYLMDYVPEPASKAPEKGVARKNFLKNLLVAWSKNLVFDFNNQPDLRSNQTFRYDPKKDQIMVVDTGTASVVDLSDVRNQLPTFFRGTTTGKNILEVVLNTQPDFSIPDRMSIGLDSDNEAPLQIIMDLAEELGYSSLAEAVRDLGIETNTDSPKWSFAEYRAQYQKYQQKKAELKAEQGKLVEPSQALRETRSFLLEYFDQILKVKLKVIKKPLSLLRVGSFIDGPLETLLGTTFTERLSKVDALSAEEGENLINEMKKVVEERFQEQNLATDEQFKNVLILMRPSIIQFKSYLENFKNNPESP